MQINIWPSIEKFIPDLKDDFIVLIIVLKETILGVRDLMHPSIRQLYRYQEVLKMDIAE